MTAVPSAGETNSGRLRIALRSIGLCVLAAGCYPVSGAPPPLTNPNAPMARPHPDCHIGAYHLTDGTVVDIAA